MNSLMSMRTIAWSSSNRNWAIALVSSVLPTPVGPRNRNEPIGRLGSCRPARARRTALATARTASSWPTTLLPICCSMRSSLLRSPSSILSTGTPVELVELLGLAVDLHADAACRLVHQVDRLVGEEAVGDVAVRKSRGSHDRGVGNADAVVELVLLLEATEDRDRILDRGLGDENR